jgi:microcystin-dependent protein
MGGAGGAETHTLTEGEMPVQDTTDYLLLAAGGIDSGLHAVTATGARSFQTGFVSPQAGLGQPHNNMQPSLALGLIIKT